MTAVTTADQTGWALPEGGSDAAEITRAAGDFGTSVRPVPTASAATPATVVEGDRTSVPPPRPEAEIGTRGAGLQTTLVATPGHLSPQVRAGGYDTVASPGDQGEPECATVAESGTVTVAEALVEALDGSDRKLLLDHIAQAYPDVVEAGAMWLAELHSAAREHQRQARNRKSKNARRRRRAEAGETWPRRG